MAIGEMNRFIIQHGKSTWDPAEAFGKMLDTGLRSFTRAQQFKQAQDYARQEQQPEQQTPDTLRQTPTPENTGAPVPGYRQRGSNITPQSTGAPVPGTLKQPTTSGKLPVKHTRAYPKKLKPTAPGTRPKPRKK